MGKHSYRYIENGLVSCLVRLSDTLKKVLIARHLHINNGTGQLGRFIKEMDMRKIFLVFLRSLYH